MRFTLSFLAAATATVIAGAALAAPGFLPLQGYLTDPSGAPIDGPRSVRFALYETPDSAADVWSEVQDVDVRGGFFLAYLGSETALDLALFRDHDGLLLGITVEDDSEMARIPLGSAGYAGFAQYCGDAETLEGYTPADLAVSAGDGLVMDAGEVALDAAGCDAGFVLKRDAGNAEWVCAPDQVGSGEPVVIGTGLLRDGVTGAVQLDQSLVESLALGVCFDSEAELTAALDGDYLPADYTPAWGDIQGLPPGFADGVDDGTAYTVGEGLQLDANQIALAPPGDTTLGGVLAKTCAAGDKVSGIATDGTVLCAEDLTQAGPAPEVPGAFVPEPIAAGSDTLSQLRVDDTHIYAILGTLNGRIVTAPKGGGMVTDLTVAQDWPTDIALDGTYVYWSNRGEPGVLKRVPKAGGDEEPLAALGPQSEAYSLTLHGGSIYWATQDGIVTMQTWGGPLTPLPGANYPADGLQVVGDTLYHTRRDGSEFYAIPLVGGVPERLYPGWLYRPAQDAAAIYGDVDGQIIRISKSDGRITSMAVLPFARGTVLERDGRLYWAGTAFATLSTDGASELTIISLTGGGSLTTDATHLYWADGSTVYRALFPW